MAESIERVTDSTIESHSVHWDSDVLQQRLNYPLCPGVRRSTRQASEQGSHCQAAAPITNKNPEASKSDKYDRNFSRSTCDLSRRFWSLSSPFIFLKSASAAASLKTLLRAHRIWQRVFCPYPTQRWQVVV